MTDSSSALTSPFSVEARETTFSIMVVSIGMSCFIWQSIESGYMVYKIRKPVHMVVFAQAVLGVVVTFVTLLTSVVNVDCTFVSDSCKLSAFEYWPDPPLAALLFDHRCECCRYCSPSNSALESIFGEQSVQGCLADRYHPFAGHCFLHWIECHYREIQFIF